MRAKDYEEFINTHGQLMRLGARAPDQVGGVEERARLATELRQKCLDKVQEFPDLVRDFDRFAACSRSTWKSMNSSG